MCISSQKWIVFFCRKVVIITQCLYALTQMNPSGGLVLGGGLYLGGETKPLGVYIWMGGFMLGRFASQFFKIIDYPLKLKREIIGVRPGSSQGHQHRPDWHHSRHVWKDAPRKQRYPKIMWWRRPRKPNCQERPTAVAWRHRSSNSVFSHDIRSHSPVQTRHAPNCSCIQPQCTPALAGEAMFIPR